MEEWAEALGGYDGQAIKYALDHCRSNVEWPPSIAEFKKLCDKFSGVPDEEQAFNAALRREFNHPIVKLAYGVVGSWAFTHSDEKSLRSKFKEAYDTARIEYSQDRAFYDKDFLTYHEDKKKIDAQPIKELTEKIPWRDRKSDYVINYDQMRKERAEEGMRIYNNHQAKSGNSEEKNEFKAKSSSSYKAWMSNEPVKVKDYFKD